ncbi:hypothetical protein [Thermomonospora amylolytica]|uniref:hypothetical protein n=1 Tax=Thermomonospora amylolytica TaxID=1411117 RepID=UPI0013005751|nr:hypothetical protein [Thermomonospora amylolytica]
MRRSTVRQPPGATEPRAAWPAALWPILFGVLAAVVLLAVVGPRPATTVRMDIRPVPTTGPSPTAGVGHGR